MVNMTNEPSNMQGCIDNGKESLLYYVVLNKVDETKKL